MLAILMIIGAVILRLVPHIPNVAPITALGLFGGRYISNKFAVFVPLFAMMVSDYLLLYINPFTMHVDFSHVYPITAMFHATTAYVWGSFIVSSIIGIWLRRVKRPEIMIGATVVASLQFFLITNFGVWAAGTYSRGLDGLVMSYVMGLPFLKLTLLGDLFYTGVFFGAFELAIRMAKRTKENLAVIH